MKKINALFLLILVSTLSYGQNWQNVSNSLQRKIVGADTFYRFNMGAPGFWNISDKFGQYYTKVQSDARYALAGAAGVSSFNGRTGAITPQLSDYAAFFSATSPIFYNSSTGVISSQAASSTLSGYINTSGQTIGGIKSFTATRTVFDGTLNLLPANGSFGTGYGGIHLGTTNLFGFKRADISSSANFDFGGLTLTRTYTFPNANGMVALTSDIPASLPTPNALTAGYGLSGSSFNGSAARTWTADTTSATGLVSKARLDNTMLSFVPKARTLTINGESYDLSANRSWTIPETDTTSLSNRINSKVTANSAITGATKAKITYDSKGLVTAGADLTESDIPSLPISKVTGLGDSLAAKANKFANYQTVYIDTLGDNSTAIVGRPDKPFATIAAALDSTTGPLKLVFSPGSFQFTLSDSSKLRSNLYFIGSGKPKVNSTIDIPSVGVQPTMSAPTKLIGGTIINGPLVFINKSNVKVQDLGVDVGSAWCTAFNGGVASEGLLFAQLASHPLQTDVPPNFGIEIENVTVLCKDATSAVHAVLVENAINPKVNNISTYYGQHGFVSKSIGGNFTNIDAHGHGNEGVDIKTNNYAYSQSTNISNVYISSIGAKDGGGLLINANDGVGVGFTNISNINIEYTTFGIKSEGIIDGLNISNGTIYDVSNHGIDFSGDVYNINISNFFVRSADSTAVKIHATGSSGSNNITLTNLLASGSNIGYDLTSTTSTTPRIRVNGLYVSGNTTTDYVFGDNVYGTNIYPGVTIGALTQEPIASGDFMAAINQHGNIGESTIAQSEVVTKTGTETLTNKTITGSFTGPLTGSATQWGGYPYSHISATTPVALMGFDSSDNTWKYVLNSNLSAATGLANLASPAFTGAPTAPTQSAGDNSTKVATTAYVDAAIPANVISGTYTPTTYSISNISSVSVVTHFYERNGNIATVTGRLSITPTAFASTASEIDIQLPVSSDFTLTDNAFGIISDPGSSFGYTSAILNADTANDRLNLAFNATSSTVSITYTIKYLVQ